MNDTNVEFKDGVVKLPADIKEKWLEALRSGRYQQGTKELRSLTNRFCCLGVLVDILMPENWKIGENRYYIQESETSTALAVLPKSISDTYGLSCTVNIHSFYYEDREINVSTLTEANDFGMSFDEIANIIERDL
jgi:hypothetical protein